MTATPMRPLRLSARTVVTALGAGVGPLRRALHERRGGLAPCDLPGTPEGIWVGRVPGLEAVALPEALAGFACRNNRLAELALATDGFAGAVAAALDGRPVPAAPEGAALADLAGEHFEAMLAFYGADLGLRVARKHLGWYLADLDGGAAALRAEIVRLGDPQAVARAIRRIADCGRKPLEDAA